MKICLHKMINFIKREAVLSIAFVLAICSHIYAGSSIKISAGYLDFRVLALLFCLMGVMAGLRTIGVFEYLARLLLRRVHTVRQLAGVLVFLCFFLSMFITNDVSLITFVPFAIMLLDMTGNRKYMVYIITLQTVAANLGSMLMPIGNPQNLYLYSISEMSFGKFVGLMLPYTVAAFLMLFAALFFIRNEGIDRAMVKAAYVDNKVKNINTQIIEKFRCASYLILFLLCLLCVMHILDFKIVFVASVIVMLLLDYKNLGRIDYCLLLTFICFFVFVGNIGKIEEIKNWLSKLITGREMIVSFGASQIISNVPAATLLSGFTDNIKDLIVGTNIGGLGTLIASLASLISFKFFSEAKGNKGSYLLCFTVVNVIFAVVLIGLYFVM